MPPKIIQARERILEQEWFVGRNTIDHDLPFHISGGNSPWFIEDINEVFPGGFPTTATSSYQSHTSQAGASFQAQANIDYDMHGDFYIGPWTEISVAHAVQFWVLGGLGTPFKFSRSTNVALVPTSGGPDGQGGYPYNYYSVDATIGGSYAHGQINAPVNGGDLLETLAGTYRGVTTVGSATMVDNGHTYTLVADVTEKVTAGWNIGAFSRIDFLSHSFAESAQGLIIDRGDAPFPRIDDGIVAARSANSSDPLSTLVGQTLTFHSTSYDPDNDDASPGSGIWGERWTLIYPDGHMLTQQLGDQATFLFDQAGLYSVMLEVMDDEAWTSSITTQVSVTVPEMSSMQLLMFLVLLGILASGYRHSKQSAFKIAHFTPRM